MAGELLLVYSIGLPALGMVAAMSAGFVSWSAATESLPRDAKRSLRGQLLVFLALSGTSVLFGLAMYALVRGRVAETPLSQLEWAALAYGVPGMMTGFAHALVFRGGVGHAVKNLREFARTLVITVLPQTTALFGFSIGFLLLGLTESDPVLIPALVESSRLSSLYMIAGSFAAPAMAYAMVRTWGFQSLDRWKKAIVAGALVETFLFAGFALSFLALTAA